MGIIHKIPDWLIGLIVTLFFLFITLTGLLDFTESIERKAFDFRAGIAASGDRNSDIELVVITDDDLSELGSFPWPRDIIARGVETLALSGAKVVALNMLFAEPEESAGLRTLGRVKESYENLGLVQKEGGQDFYRELLGALADLDNDAKFFKALEDAGNVVLPVRFDTGSTGRDLQGHDSITKHALQRITGNNKEEAVSSLIRPSEIRPLLPSFAQVAAGIGHTNLFPDKDGCIRSQVHVLPYSRDVYVPSLSMAIVKVFMGLKD